MLLFGLSFSRYKESKPRFLAAAECAGAVKKLQNNGMFFILDLHIIALQIYRVKFVFLIVYVVFLNIKVLKRKIFAQKNGCTVQPFFCYAFWFVKSVSVSSITEFCCCTFIARPVASSIYRKAL